MDGPGEEEGDDERTFGGTLPDEFAFVGDSDSPIIKQSVTCWINIF